MRWIACMTTCERKRSTLPQTAASLAAAGWSDVRLFVDAKMSGARNAFLHVLSEAAGGDWDRLLFVQDDVLFVGGLREWVESQHDSGRLPAGVVSLWMPEIHQRRDNSGWWRIPDNELPRKAYGALAYVLDRPTVDAILQTGNYSGQPNKLEFLVGYVCQKRNIGYWYYRRSFCQHIGSASTISPGIPSVRYFRNAANDWNTPPSYNVT